MTDSKNKKTVSTGEIQKDINDWPDEDLHNNAQFKADSNIQTPPTSPILCGKRLASSPIIGGFRTISKKSKKSKKNLMTVSTKCSNLKTSNESNGETSNHFTDICLNPISLETAKTVIKKYNEKEDQPRYLKNDDRNSTNILQEPCTSKIISIPLSISNQVLSQLIESESIDGSSENSELDFVENASDSDKTVSDLIEDVSTQLTFEESYKHKEVLLSQNISHPSSNSSQSMCDISIIESTNIHTTQPSVTEKNINCQSLNVLSSIDLIDSSSTTESKSDFMKASYILQYPLEKPKKKCFKKGSLFNLLLETIGKERSNVNLLRHQLYRKPNNIFEKPFILLQIIQHLPMMNKNQILKCILVEDISNLLSHFIKGKNINFITVINVPEISCIINLKQKPILKVFEPWTIIDPNQLFLHITRFIAIPAIKNAETSIAHDSICNKKLQIKQEFHCPCIDNKMLSQKCKSKFYDTIYNPVKIVFNYN